MAARDGEVQGSSRRAAVGDHHHGWNEAMDAALRKLNGNTEHYEVQFNVRVSPNPGKINEYLVTLIPR